MHQTSRTVVVIAAAAIAGACLAAQDTRFEDDMLVASDGEKADQFGQSVAVDGRFIAVGAWSDDNPNGSGAGAVYLFEHSDGEWIEAQKLIASNGGFEEDFGFALAMDDDFLVVGAPGANGIGDNTGAAYVYRFDGVQWIEDAILSASDGESGDSFGYAVDCVGEVIVVGAHAHDAGFGDAGAAYVYRFDGVAWVEEQKLASSELSSLDQFGLSVAAEDGLVICGAPGEDGAVGDAGAAFVFRFDGVSWVEEAQLIATAGEANASFGAAVTVDGQIALVGAYRSDRSGMDAGSAHIFRYNGIEWVEEQELISPDGAVNDQFGRSVAVDGERIVVGTLRGDGRVADSGAAYSFLFDGGNWIDEFELVASNGDFDDQLAEDIAMDGMTVVCGARTRDIVSSNEGAAYIFDLSPPCELLLTIEGECPGFAIGTVSCAEPGDLIAIIYGTRDGSAGPIPGCPGLFVDIENPTVVDWGPADASGEFSVFGFIPPEACGLLRVQGINLTTCELTNVAKL